jgi:hypothetical protein
MKLQNNQFNPNDFLFRCSGLGNIISKSGKLTDGVKTYVEETFISYLYNVEKDISSKYLEKGNACEQEGIDMSNKIFCPNKFLTSYKKQNKNEFIIGTPDLVIKDFVVDIKNAYDLFTFGKAELSHKYIWQLKGYMWLLGLTKAKLMYVLIDMPDYLFAKEEKKLFYEGNFLTFESTDFMLACKDLKKKYMYDYLQFHERFKIWDVELTDQDVLTIQESVLVARKYMVELYIEHNLRLERNCNLLK